MTQENKVAVQGGLTEGDRRHKPRLSRHAFLEIVRRPGGWRTYGVHLAAVHAAWTERRRRYEHGALLAAIRLREPGPHARLDYLFAPGDYAANVRSCTVVTTAPARDASDHFPLQAELDLDF